MGAWGDPHRRRGGYAGFLYLPACFPYKGRSWLRRRIGGRTLRVRAPAQDPGKRGAGCRRARRWHEVAVEAARPAGSGRRGLRSSYRGPGAVGWEPASVRVAVGDTAWLRAVARDSEGREVALVPLSGLLGGSGVVRDFGWVEGRGTWVVGRGSGVVVLTAELGPRRAEAEVTIE